MPAKLFNKQRLLTPGPTSVPEAVLLEMAQPIIHHRTKQFQAIFKEVSERLQRLFHTTGPVLSIAGSGTTSFEAAQISPRQARVQGRSPWPAASSASAGRTFLTPTLPPCASK